MIITPDGEIVQSKVFGNIWQNNVFDLIETSDGGFFMASKAEVVEGMVQGEHHGLTDVWAIKLDPNLNIEWQKLYGGSEDDYGYNGVLELDDCYLFLALTESDDFDVTGFHGGFSDIWVVRIDTVGNIIWEKCLGGSGSDRSGTLHKTEDGGFMIVGETTSNDGDVSGNHPWQGNYYNDIWMVKLSSDGGLEWQKCYGSHANERVYKGVVQKSDDNWVIAGRTVANTYDVDCNLHGAEDYWIFEIKDCSQYPVGSLQAPTGPDTTCTVYDSTNLYTISAATGAWYYEWQLIPEEAGTINGNDLLATTTWAVGWEGTAAITARAMNDCDTSAWSEACVTEVYTCLGINTIQAGGIMMKVYPNPARGFVVFETSGIKGLTLSKTLITKNSRLTIIDIFGQTVAELPLVPEKTTWHTDKVKNGIYFYRIEIDGKVLSGKIVIQ